jgi:predicted permease
MPLATWLNSLYADAVFGWRRLMKNKVASAASVLSLAIAIGSCTSVFRIIDALLLRPLPISEPQHLYLVSYEATVADGTHDISDGCSYPLFRRMLALVRNQAELIAISYAQRTDLTYGSNADIERAYRQFVSGRMFSAFGIQAALGRLLTESDDLKPGGNPYAVLSYDYWTHRFGQDPNVIGRKFRMGNYVYEIVGVGPKRFTGVEPGTVTDIFVPMTMNVESLNSANSFWFRTFLLPKPGVAVTRVQDKLEALYRGWQSQRAKGFVGFPEHFLERHPISKLMVSRAASGVSGMQEDYGTSLMVLGVLVAIVLLIACANVANLITIQAAARAREMALRVSIGARRWRLVQLVLVEGAWLAVLGALIGALFAWWSAPFIVSRINPLDHPARLYLPADWRILGFGLGLTLGVTLLFSLAPALRASAVHPATALKGGESPQARRRFMHTLIASQTSFCFVVIFIATLFVATFDRLANRPTGFSPDRLLTLETMAQPAQSPVYWNQVAQDLRAVPGVESVALAAWPLMSGIMSNSFISVNGAPPSDTLAYFLKVSPGWIETMGIPLIDGRNFHPGEISPGVAIVNKAFARRYFNGENVIGKAFEITGVGGVRTRYEIVGLVGDAIYSSIREPVLPQVYIPFRSANASGALTPTRAGTFIVRTFSSNPLALAPTLRREVARARPEFRVSNILTQAEIDQSQTVRERLLARLAVFFSAVALLLAGVGLYGVFDYCVLQRRREMAIRIALGAKPANVARRVTADIFVAICAGVIGGVALGFALVRYIGSLLYEVRPTDLRILIIPLLSILAAILLAALPPLIRAVRTDPSLVLRAE